MKVETEIVPEFLDFEAAGTYVSVSKYSVRRWVRVGLLPASRVGQLVRVKRSDLDALMASRRTIAGRPA
jgi:excisionase family DNA binding protein